MEIQQISKVKRNQNSKYLEVILNHPHNDYHIPFGADGFLDIWRNAPKHLKHKTPEGMLFVSRPDAEEIEKEIAYEIHRIGSNNFEFTTGGPGSGKSTKLVNDYTKNPGPVVAPSGVAAQRLAWDLMAVCTKFGQTAPEPSTIHSAFQIPVVGAPKWAQSNGRAKGKKRCDSVFVDEASMIDTQLFLTMLRRLKVGCKVFIYGDPDQLPPVGRGSPLLSLAGHVGKHVALKGNFRAQNQFLTDAISDLNEGKWPEDCQGFKTVRLNADFGAACRQTAMMAYTNGAQIITPWRASAQCSGRVHASLSRKERKTGKVADFTSFVKGDEIVSCHSIHAASVTNGVRYIYEGKTVANWKLKDVNNGSQFKVPISSIKKAAEFSMDQIKDPAEWETSSCFLFAGGLTIHKSQGSQYSSVVILIQDTKHLEFYSRAMTYVAASRAKHDVTVLISAAEDRVEEIKAALLKKSSKYISRVPEHLKNLEGSK